MPVLLYGQEEKGEGLNMNEYSAMTPEIEKLRRIVQGTQPEQGFTILARVRGLRDVNGKGVLAGLTDISTITSSKIVDGERVPCEGELRYRGYDIKDIVNGFVKEGRFGFEETAYLLIFGQLPDADELSRFQKLLGSYRCAANELCPGCHHESAGKRYDEYTPKRDPYAVQL